MWILCENKKVIENKSAFMEFWIKFVNFVLKLRVVLNFW